MTQMTELKNGQTVNGTLQEIDRFMNLRIGQAVVTSKVASDHQEGDTFHRQAELFIKGNAIKAMQLVEGLLEVAEKKGITKGS